MRPMIGKTDFTHFASLPFIRNHQRQSILNLKNSLDQILTSQHYNNQFRKSSHNLCHLTLAMLTLHNQSIRNDAYLQMKHISSDLKKTLKNTKICFSKLGYFTKFNYQSKQREVSIIYIDASNDANLKKVSKAVDILIKTFLKSQIVSPKDFRRMHITHQKQTNQYLTEQHHLTLYRVNGVLQDQKFKQTFEKLCKAFKPIQLQCDFLDISTRFQYDESKFYKPLSRIILDSE